RAHSPSAPPGSSGSTAGPRARQRPRQPPRRRSANATSGAGSAPRRGVMLVVQGSPRAPLRFRGWTAGTPSARRRLAGREEGVDDDGADPDPQGAHGRDEHLALAPGGGVRDVPGPAAGGRGGAE